MSSQRRVWIRCNGMSCGETYAEEDKFERVGEVRARARKEGWSRRGGADYCPGCTRTRAMRFYLSRRGPRRI